MKERPIIFSAQMVRALLAGTKTQTRRAVKENDQHNLYCGCKISCPYGHPGDRLWVNETWRTTRGLDHCKPTGLSVGAPIQYEADQWLPGHGLAEPGKTRVSIFMCRWMSRITLEITSVRIERLQSITEADACAEGVSPIATKGEMQSDGSIRPLTLSARTLYQGLWTHINGHGSWDANLYVWVITFKRIKP